MAQASLLSSGVAALTATVATATTSCRSPVVAPSGVHLGLAPLEVSSRGKGRRLDERNESVYPVPQVFENLAIGFLPCFLIAYWVREKDGMIAKRLVIHILGILAIGFFPCFLNAFWVRGKDGMIAMRLIIHILGILAIGFFPCFLNAFWVREKDCITAMRLVIQFFGFW